jgi:hypothetical protein
MGWLGVLVWLFFWAFSGTVSVLHDLIPRVGFLVMCADTVPSRVPRAKLLLAVRAAGARTSASAIAAGELAERVAQLTLALGTCLRLVAASATSSKRQSNHPLRGSRGWSTNLNFQHSSREHRCSIETTSLSVHSVGLPKERLYYILIMLKSKYPHCGGI